jgi:hypothetical protein
MVGAVRFELTTSCTRNKRASQATLRPDPEQEKVPVDAANGKKFVGALDGSTKFAGPKYEIRKSNLKMGFLNQPCCFSGITPGRFFRGRLVGSRVSGQFVDCFG